MSLPYIIQNKFDNWVRIPTCCEPDFDDKFISEFSLISMMSYMNAKKTNDSRGIQNLYKVIIFDPYILMFGPLYSNVWPPIFNFETKFQRLISVAYQLYISTHLNLEFQHLQMGDSANATEFFERRGAEMALNNTDASLVPIEFVYEAEEDWNTRAL